jgi:hypothetical protein
MHYITVVFCQHKPWRRKDGISTLRQRQVIVQPQRGDMKGCVCFTSLRLGRPCGGLPRLLRICRCTGLEHSGCWKYATIPLLACRHHTNLPVLQVTTLVVFCSYRASLSDAQWPVRHAAITAVRSMQTYCQAALVPSGNLVASVTQPNQNKTDRPAMG